MRIMGLDFGDKKIGVALSDPMGWTAQGLEVIHSGGSVKSALARISELVQQYEVQAIVLGLPKNMNGTVGERGEKTLQFGRQLEKLLGLPVHMWDERLSTSAAERVLLEADVSRAKRKKVVDKMAASIILQGYLDRISKSH